MAVHPDRYQSCAIASRKEGSAHISKSYISRIGRVYSPWRVSCLRRPLSQGMARLLLSFLWEAVIEAERSVNALITFKNSSEICIRMGHRWRNQKTVSPAIKVVWWFFCKTSPRSTKTVFAHTCRLAVARLGVWICDSYSPSWYVLIMIKIEQDRSAKSLGSQSDRNFPHFTLCSLGNYGSKAIRQQHTTWPELSLVHQYPFSETLPPNIYRRT